MLSDKEAMSPERFERFIDEAARAAGYEEGFGVTGSDLNLRHWWAAYTRQSTREQAENDRLGEYLLTCARLAKQKGVVVPREYILYDTVSCLASSGGNNKGDTIFKYEPSQIEWQKYKAT